MPQLWNVRYTQPVIVWELRPIKGIIISFSRNVEYLCQTPFRAQRHMNLRTQKPM